MRLLASFFATDYEKLKKHWQCNSPLKRNGVPGTNKAISKNIELGGQLIRLDWDKKEILLSTPISCASGFDICGDTIFIGSMRDHHILNIRKNDFSPIRIISHPYINDIHSIHMSRNGLLAASSAMDLILELDGAGRSSWEWWATENGYILDQLGKNRTIDKTISHTDKSYPTLLHTTHLNSAIHADNDETVCFASLFYQGEVIRINKKNLEKKTLLTGLKNPHSIYRISETEFMVSDTQNSRLLLFDAHGRIMHEVHGDFNWVQDAIMTAGGTFLVADSNNHRIVEIDTKSKIVDEFRYSKDWKIYQIMEEPPL